MSETFEKMDRMYHLQRHFYDATRKYYLLGRDQLLRELNVRPGETVLEVGCGTGRNLVILAKRLDQPYRFGERAIQTIRERFLPEHHVEKLLGLYADVAGRS